MKTKAKIDVCRNCEGDGFILVAFSYATIELVCESCNGRGVIT